MTPKAERERRERARQKKLEKAEAKARADFQTTPPPVVGEANRDPAAAAATNHAEGEGLDNGLIPLERIYELTGETVLLPKKAGEKFPAGNGSQKITLEISRTPAHQNKLRKAALESGICLRLGRLSNGLLSVDFDVDEPALAAKLLELFRSHHPWARHALTNRGRPNRCQIFFRSSGYPLDKEKLLICFRDGTVVGELRNGEGNQWQSAFTGMHPDTRRPYVCLVEEPAPNIGPWSEPFLPPELMLVREKDWRKAYGSSPANGGGATTTGAEGSGAQEKKFKDCNLWDLNLVKLLRALGVKVTKVGERSAEDEDIYAISPCPWRNNHTEPDGKRDTVVWQLAGGGKWPTFLCSHNHCADKGLLAVLEWAESKKPGIVKRFCMRSELVLPSGSVPYPGSARALYSGLARLYRYFVRGTLIEEIVQDKEGRNILQPLTANALRHRVDLHFRTVAWRNPKGDKHVKKLTRCPHDAAVVLLGATEAVELLPGIKTLSTCPVLWGPSGKIEVLGCDYHPQGGGIYVFGNQKNIPIPPLAEALTAFDELLCDYQFVTGSDKARAVASFISPALRAGGLLGEVDFPIDVAEADASQSGKTYRQKLVCAVYGAEPYVIAKRQGGVGSLDESVSSAIFSGAPFILMDNFRGPFNSQFIESCVRGPGRMSIRVPHHGSVQLPTGYINWQLSSNGVEGGPDFVNRIIVTGIKKHQGGYKFREYAGGVDILRRVKAEQERYLGAVFAVVKEWDCAGRPGTGEVRHNFREWARALDWIVQRVFGLPALLDGHAEEILRMSNPGLSWLRQIAITLDRLKRIGEKLDTPQIVELCEIEGVGVAGARRDADELQLQAQAGRMLGRAFSVSGARVTIDRYQITRGMKMNQFRHQTPEYHFEYRP